MKPGQTVYKVEWKQRQPYIWHGKVQQVGKKRFMLMVKDRGGKLVAANDFSTSIKASIEAEILSCGNVYCNPLFNARKPWDMVLAVIKLWRLYRKLQTRNLV